LKFALQLRFRGSSEEISSLLPPEFQFLAGSLVPGEAVNTCRAYVVAPREAGEAVVVWGRQLRNNATVLAGANIIPIYEREDLGSSELVELCMSHNVDKCRVLNAKAALNVVWACPHCERARSSQTAELQVELPQDYGMHLSYNNEWIVPASYIPFLDHYKLKTRPLGNTTENVQILLDQTVSLHDGYAPIVSYGPGCPGCGLKSLRRHRGLEGNPLDQTFTGLVMYTDYPVTIKPVDVSKITLARSVERLHNPRTSSTPWHKAGQPIDYRHIAQHYYDARPIFVAKAELVGQLFEAETPGFAFRPVNIASA